MLMIVVGCGRLGADLAQRMVKQKHSVVVIDDDEKAFENLPADFPCRTVVGDALNRGVLERAGIGEAHGLAAVTSSDTVNAIIARVAQEHFKVPFVVSRNYDPHYRKLHEAFNVQVVSSTSWGAQRIEELLYHGPVRMVYSAGNGEVEVYELLVPAQWHEHRLSELLPESGCVPIALTRSGHAVIPGSEVQLQAGDLLQVGATLDGVLKIRQRLNNPGK